GDRTRFWLKVQDGCDYYCTYCTIPFARGRSRSGSIAELTEEARKVAAEGGKEIVITGVNIGDFGRDTGEKFFDLLKSLDSVEGIERYRISSIEPNLITEEIIDWIATEARAFTPHFHIPLQAGSDAVLKLMNRRYDTSLFKKRIRKIREAMPDAFIGIDIIAGARGETEEEWEKSFSFVEALPVDKLHVFPYSERPGTKALNIGHIVSQEEKHRRVGCLTDLSDRKLSEFMQERIGREYDVLWEQPAAGNDRMHGFTPNYLRVVAPLDESKINTISRVRLTAIDESETDSFTAEHLPKTESL
ncbi:MAG: MiaB/RimO family radical SAM methylthiotransferase, partial [Muribaculaceae bacterium]|nr:MiaB/RimO family radical SAM methylthiotransferase [Muribaculaceae bacterium]